MNITTAPYGHNAKTGLELQSVRDDVELELSLVAVGVRSPQADEVVVRVEASPINPSDLGLMVAVADMSTAKPVGTSAAPVVTARIPKERMNVVAGRVGQSMTVGNEGAGVVVEAGCLLAVGVVVSRPVLHLQHSFCLVQA